MRARGGAGWRWWVGGASLAVLLAMAACGEDQPADVASGRQAIARAGCGACHTIPGVDGADAVVAPPLTHWAGRATVAGVVANTTENLERWLEDPRDVVPGTAMPDLGLSEEQIHDIAAYLMSLE